jgi:hypothetical protein
VNFYCIGSKLQEAYVISIPNVFGFNLIPGFNVYNLVNESLECVCVQFVPSLLCNFIHYHETIKI